MSFDSQWNEVYSKKGMASYPDNALIRFVAKHYYNVPDRKAVTFLDVGSGAGASTWYLAREGFSVVAIDGSKVAIKRLEERLKADNLIAITCHCDLLTPEYIENQFDCVVDVSSLCYVPDPGIEKVMHGLYTSLKPGGRIFSITPSEECDKEPFQNVGDANLEARFLTVYEISRLFSQFKNVEINPYTYVTTDNKHVVLLVVSGEK